MNTIKAMIRASSVMATITLLAACRHLGTPEVTPGSSLYPEKNPGPHRQVVIRGTVSGSLTMTLAAIYEGKIAADCWTSPVFSGGGFEGSAIPLKVTVPLSVARAGEGFSAGFDVDPFLPGKCGWHFAAINVRVSKGQLSTVAHIIQAYDPRINESQGINSSAEPVIMSCRNLVGMLGYGCVPFKGQNKTVQIVLDTTAVVNVIITDVDPP